MNTVIAAIAMIASAGAAQIPAAAPSETGTTASPVLPYRIPTEIRTIDLPPSKGPIAEPVRHREDRLGRLAVDIAALRDDSTDPAPPLNVDRPDFRPSPSRIIYRRPADAAPSPTPVELKAELSTAGALVFRPAPRRPSRPAAVKGADGTYNGVAVNYVP